jgi:hypothetical protein
MMEELMFDDLEVDFCRSQRTGDIVLVLQKRYNDYERFAKITKYGGGRTHSYVIISKGRNGSGWHCCITQLRKLVKHVEQKGFACQNHVPSPVQPHVVEKGGRTFTKVVVGEGQTKELE